MTAPLEYGPWNPGLRSPVPRELAQLSTLYRPENTNATLDEVRELADFTGLAPEALVTFTPRRLAVHELLVRVAADISVPDGPGSEDLGVNFRAITSTILDRHVSPRLGALESAYAELRAALAGAARTEVDRILAASLPRPCPAPAQRRWLARIARLRQGSAPDRAPKHSRPRQSRADREAELIGELRARPESESRERRVLWHLLADVLGAVRARHGRIVGEPELLARLATDAACNVLGSELIGRLVEPCIEAAIRTESYRRLPTQARPVVMNTKGASASGKSTMRPLQRQLAARIGVDWEDFSLISPDIFRKFLLDYDSLGPAYRYAGMLTGHELRIVDQKLDRHIAEKAARGEMSHLLIDRFRFDSFAPESDERGSNLLTRFGSAIFMFFMITPPHATVVRAWERGQRVGRYKTVDDLLYHNVEAFSGMPDLFFTWALRTDKSVHYEFLDNAVAPGERPLTVAFGADGNLVVLDIVRLLDIERHRRIDVDAKSPEEVYPPEAELEPARNAGFLGDCVRRLSVVEFAERDTGRVYLRTEAGAVQVLDPQGLRRAGADGQTGPALEAVFGALSRSDGHGRVVDASTALTLGRWGAVTDGAQR